MESQGLKKPCFGTRESGPCVPSNEFTIKHEFISTVKRSLGHDYVCSKYSTTKNIPSRRRKPYTSLINLCPVDHYGRLVRTREG